MIAPRSHFVGRFIRSLLPQHVSADDRAWVASMLQPQEQLLWGKLSAHDMVESLGVAHRAAAQIDANDSEYGDVIAAALLHDVGKLDAHFGTYGRVAATLAGALAGHEMAESWRHSSGRTRRVGLYLQHAELGADRIAIAGGRTAAVEWARAHHDPSRWASVPLSRRHCQVLATADGERPPNER